MIFSTLNAAILGARTLCADHPRCHRPLDRPGPHPGDAAVTALLAETTGWSLGHGACAEELYLHTAGWLAPLAPHDPAHFTRWTTGDLVAWCTVVADGAAFTLSQAYGSTKALVGVRSALAWVGTVPPHRREDEDLRWAVGEARRSLRRLLESPPLA